MKKLAPKVEPIQQTRSKPMAMRPDIAVHYVRELIVEARSFDANEQHGAFSTLTIACIGRDERERVTIYFNSPVPPSYAFALADMMKTVKAPDLAEATP